MELVILLILALAFAVIAAGFYRAGVRDGARLRGKGEISPVFRPPAGLRPPAMAKPAKKSGEQKRAELRISRVLENIDNYNGSPLGQKEVV